MLTAEAGGPARWQHPHVHLGRQPGDRRGELVRRVGQPVGLPQVHEVGEERAPVDRYGDPRPQQRGGPRGRLRIEMAVSELVRRRPVPEPVLTTGTARRFWTEQYDDKTRLS